ncbi:hypothetical protein Tco_1172390 [Tanacetum coccineum]
MILYEKSLVSQTLKVTDWSSGSIGVILVTVELILNARAILKKGERRETFNFHENILGSMKVGVEIVSVDNVLEYSGFGQAGCLVLSKWREELAIVLLGRDPEPEVEAVLQYTNLVISSATSDETVGVEELVLTLETMALLRD